MKTCRTCCKEKPLHDFVKNKNMKGGYLNDCKDCVRERSAQYYAENRESAIAASKRWIANNHEHVLERKRKYRAEHKAELYEKFIEWVKKNPLKWYIHTVNRKARKHGGKGVTAEEWVALCDQFDNRCVGCGRGNVELTQGHVLPTSKDGKHEIENLQPLCRSCNSRKNTKAIDYRVTFAARFGE